MAKFSITRSTTISASQEKVREHITSLRAWQSWSPWEGLDTELERTYTGPDVGVGAHYSWSGKKSGTGSMEIVTATEQQTEIDLQFTKPWRATNQVLIGCAPRGAETEVTWTMKGENRGLSALFARFMNMDAMLGKDFEKGLAQLKAVAEG